MNNKKSILILSFITILVFSYVSYNAGKAAVYLKEGTVLKQKDDYCKQELDVLKTQIKDTENLCLNKIKETANNCPIRPKG